MSCTSPTERRHLLQIMTRKNKMQVLYVSICAYIPEFIGHFLYIMHLKNEHNKDKTREFGQSFTTNIKYIDRDDK